MRADTPADTAPDYRDTLFLPDTVFPMRAGLPTREPGWLERWEKIGIYDRLREKGASRPSFVLHDGPPYANGNLHIGHALNKVLKDFIVRSRQMMGHDSRYVPGWDCHGLPIEWKIEEQYRAKGLNKDDVDVVAFRQECRRFAEGWVDIQREEFKRLGVTGNWADPYLTMDYRAEAVIAAEFMTFVMNGSLYQGSKPVMWSPVEKTALAEAEVEYHDKESPTIWVKFPLRGLEPVAGEVNPAGPSMEDLKAFGEAFADVSVVIWTTTPWTIPQNRAICFNPAIAYGLYRVTEAPEGNWAAVGDKVMLADDLAAQVFKAAKVAGFERLRDVPPRLLGTMVCAHPLEGTVDNGEWDYPVPLLPGDHVTSEAGTGFVHTAPSHGDDDYQIGLKHGLEMTWNVLEDGTFRPDLPIFGGLPIILPNGKEGTANAAVIAVLTECKALLARGRLKHSYPHSWRSKAPLIYRNTPQWFVAIDKPLSDGMGAYGDTIRQRALRSIDELVTWTPRTGRNRLHSMIEARPDWVLSRQRAWGVPLTCFVRKGARPDAADFLLRDPAVNARIVKAFEAEGADAWYAEGAKARFLDGLHDPDAYDQVFDILDVWFDSGSTHAFVLRDRADGTEDGIADVYLEGTDQHRGWFHSSMLQACGTIGRAPYRAVVTHGFTLDEKGMKMSKSLGNTVAPQTVIKEYGADILRLWVAQSDYTADLRIGKEILKGTADSYRRLRNTMRYMLGALNGWDGAVVPRESMPLLDRWILHRLSHFDLLVRKHYEAYDFQGLFQEVFNFMTSDLSAFYFDVRKDVLYCEPQSSEERRAYLTVLDLLFHRLTTWLAPILPFTMEDVWLSRFPSDEGSVHLQDFPTPVEEWYDDAAAGMIPGIMLVRSAVLSCLEQFRKEKVIGSSLEAAPIVHMESQSDFQNMKDLPWDEICITSGLTFTDAPPPHDAFRHPDIPCVAVVFAMADGDKCLRCWKILPDVGTHAHPGTCARCDAALG